MTILTLYGLWPKMVLHTLNLNDWNHLPSIFMIGLFEGKLKNKLKHLWKAQFQIGSSDFFIQMWAFSPNVLMTAQNILQVTIKILSTRVLFTLCWTYINALSENCQKSFRKSSFFSIIYICVFTYIL